MFREAGDARSDPAELDGGEETLADDHVARVVLGWVNDLRLEHALGAPLAHLPSGYVRDAEHCVVARAVHPGCCVVEDDTLTLYSRTDELRDSWGTGLPSAVIVLLESFDAGGTRNSPGPD